MREFIPNLYTIFAQNDSQIRQRWRGSVKFLKPKCQATYYALISDPIYPLRLKSLLLSLESSHSTEWLFSLVKRAICFPSLAIITLVIKESTNGVPSWSPYILHIFAISREHELNRLNSLNYRILNRWGGRGWAIQVASMDLNFGFGCSPAPQKSSALLRP